MCGTPCLSLNSLLYRSDCYCYCNRRNLDCVQWKLKFQAEMNESGQITRHGSDVVCRPVQPLMAGKAHLVVVIVLAHLGLLCAVRPTSLYCWQNPQQSLILLP